MTQTSVAIPTSERAADLLARNLAALAVFSPRTADLIRSAQASDEVEFRSAPDGTLTATLRGPGAGHALTSRLRPLDEARTLANSVPLDEAAGIVVIGFGAGHHAAFLSERVRRAAVVVVFEPDVRLLRAVLERIDHTRTFLASRLCVLTDAEDSAAVARAVQGCEGLLAMGVRILHHPPSRARLRQSGEAFARTFTRVFSAVRTAVVTTLAHAELTLRNQLQNVDRYASTPGIEDLRGAASGRPAVVVSAGPSLERNLHLLAPPGVRERVVIVAVQTVLRTLLARGIRPHYVTALDHHEISRRFYEGLDARAVEGVTLVVEAKANPAILGAWPGAVRTPADAVLDRLLAPSLALAKGEIRAGATVAHMAYYLARHLGCDPVILIGQDLGFTDAKYYASGAAIHETWSGELNPFNSLEAMEWQRIVRARHLLHRATDTRGRAIYTDEQMATYLVQFERDFAQDAAAGLRVVDATEGGVAKRSTHPDTLERALAQATRPLPRLPITPAPRPELVPIVRTTLARAEADSRRIGEAGREAERLLESMLERQHDQRAVGRLIDRVYRLRDEVESLRPAFDLVGQLNQTGSLKRAKADRLIEVDPTLGPLERQRREIERDLVNVRWTADAADQLASLLGDARHAVDGGPRVTRDPAPVQVRAVEPRGRAAAVVLAQGRTLFAERPALESTLERLSRVPNLDAIVVVSPDHPGLPTSLPSAAQDRPDAARPVLVHMDDEERRRLDAVRAARVWSSWCWRGGLGGLTCYDEAFAPRATRRALGVAGADAAIVVGGDWALIDPGLVEQVVDRFHERRAFAFALAPPGLGACVLPRALVDDMAAAANPIAGSIGALLGYIPVAPRSDPIARPECVTTDSSVRDLGVRCIPDSDPARRTIEAALAGARGLPLAELASRLARRLADAGEDAPALLTLELCTGRQTGGRRARWLRGEGESPERPILDPRVAEEIFESLARARGDAGVALAGAGDPMLHPDFLHIVRAAKNAGIASLHVRTDLLAPRDAIDALFDSGVDVISVDLMAEDERVYRSIMGADRFREARANLEHLLARRAGALHPWIVPRLTKCDANLDQMERFYDRWLLAAGACAIDPHPLAGAPDADEPIRAIPRPRHVLWREAGRVMTVWSDASVTHPRTDRRVGSLDREPLREVWARLWRARRDAIARERSP